MNAPKRQSRFERDDEVVVMKFGGTSVEDAAAIRRLIGIVRRTLDSQPVVVVSALARVTDQLLEAGNAAASGHLGAALAAVRNIYVRHEALADELADRSVHTAPDCELRSEIRALESLLRGVEVSRWLGARTQDRLLGFGECLSSRIVQSALAAAGINAAHVDARTCIITDDQHGHANPLWESTQHQIQDTIVPLLEAGAIPVLGGFIGSAPEGVPSTLGKGGSDFSAAIVASALDASRIEIWTDVDGIMTRNVQRILPGRVKRYEWSPARSLP